MTENYSNSPAELATYHRHKYLHLDRVSTEEQRPYFETPLATNVEQFLRFRAQIDKSQRRDLLLRAFEVVLMSSLYRWRLTRLFSNS